DLGVVGSEKWMQAQITAMEEQRSKLDVTSEAYKNLGLQIGIYKKTLESIQNPAQTIFEGSEEWYNREIQLMEAQVSKLDMMSDAYKSLKKQIEIYRNTLEMQQNPATDEAEPAFDTVDWYKKQIDDLEKMRSQAGITLEEFKRISNEINVLETTFKMQVEGVDEVNAATNK